MKSSKRWPHRQFVLPWLLCWIPFMTLGLMSISPAVGWTRAILAIGVVICSFGMAFKLRIAKDELAVRRHP